MQEGVCFEKMNVLHHLAHMAMNVDILGYRIYSRAAPSGPYRSAKDRMRGWAVTASARDARFYTLRFLSNVLCSGWLGPPFIL